MEPTPEELTSKGRIIEAIVASCGGDPVPVRKKIKELCALVSSDAYDRGRKFGNAETRERITNILFSEDC